MDTQTTHQKPTGISSKTPWFDLKGLMQVQLTSEVAAYSLDSAFSSDGGNGWQAGHTGEQTIRFLFAKPLEIRRIRLVFEETEKERTQEFVLRWSSKSGKTYQELIRQQYNFSPTGATCEVEEYQVELHDATSLELQIVPDVSGSAALASLKQIQLA